MEGQQSPVHGTHSRNPVGDVTLPMDPWGLSYGIMQAASPMANLDMATPMTLDSMMNLGFPLPVPLDPPSGNVLARDSAANVNMPLSMPANTMPSLDFPSFVPDIPADTIPNADLPYLAPPDQSGENASAGESMDNFNLPLVNLSLEGVPADQPMASSADTATDPSLENASAGGPKATLDMSPPPIPVDPVANTHWPPTAPKPQVEDISGGGSMGSLNTPPTPKARQPMAGEPMADVRSRPVSPKPPAESVQVNRAPLVTPHPLLPRERPESHTAELVRRIANRFGQVAIHKASPNLAPPMSLNSPRARPGKQHGPMGHQEPNLSRRLEPVDLFLEDVYVEQQRFALDPTQFGALRVIFHDKNNHLGDITQLSQHGIVTRRAAGLATVALHFDSAFQHLLNLVQEQQTPGNANLNANSARLLGRFSVVWQSFNILLRTTQDRRQGRASVPHMVVYPTMDTDNHPDAYNWRESSLLQDTPGRIESVTYLGWLLENVYKAHAPGVRVSDRRRVYRILSRADLGPDPLRRILVSAHIDAVVLYESDGRKVVSPLAIVEVRADPQQTESVIREQQAAKLVAFLSEETRAVYERKNGFEACIRKAIQRPPPESGLPKGGYIVLLSQRATIVEIRVALYPSEYIRQLQVKMSLATRGRDFFMHVYVIGEYDLSKASELQRFCCIMLALAYMDEERRGVAWPEQVAMVGRQF